MANKVNLKIMKCPTCGASLKAENSSDTITCVYCGNAIVPVEEATVTPESSQFGSFNGTLKVEGIKTSSSALAYLEQFFEEYDWEAFSYAQTLSIAEIDKLANSLKVSSADDKNTWFVCFKAIAEPFTHKTNGCQQILSTVIDEYKEDSLDAYSKFDAYKRIAAMLTTHKDGVVANLEKIVSNAAKYGASSTEVKNLNAEIDSIKALPMLTTYQSIESIPEIQTFIEEKNAKIVQALAAEGIDAEKEYLKAKELVAAKNYVEALNILLSLKGYADSGAIAEKIDRYYLLSNVLEIEGNLYYFVKGLDERNLFNLHATANQKIEGKPLIKNIGNIITNYADILYFLDGNGMLKEYHLSTKTEKTIYNKPLSYKSIYVYKKKAFLIAKTGGEYEIQKNDLIELDLTTGKVQVVLKEIKSIVSLTDNKLIYTAVQKSAQKGGDFQTVTNILNIDTKSIVEFGSRQVSFVGFFENYAIYTQAAPNDYNKALYIRALEPDAPEKLIESNIFAFRNIIAGKLFYTVGNSRNESLITINCDGTDRKEWPLYISDILFEQGGWLYFIRKAGYNSVLCKSRLDGKKFCVIASDIKEFIEIKNGYLYYINNHSTLVRVRMDGSNLQKLCNDVESVLSVKEDKIIFVSVDDHIKVGSYTEITTKAVKSIYAISFSGSGKIKLAYNIKSAKTYDENTIYYVSAIKTKPSANNLTQSVDILCELDVETNAVKPLLSLNPPTVQQRFPIGMMIALAAIAVLLLFFLGIIFGVGTVGGVLGM